MGNGMSGAGYGRLTIRPGECCVEFWVDIDQDVSAGDVLLSVRRTCLVWRSFFDFMTPQKCVSSTTVVSFVLSTFHDNPHTIACNDGCP